MPSGSTDHHHLLTTIHGESGHWGDGVGTASTGGINRSGAEQVVQSIVDRKLGLADTDRLGKRLPTYRSPAVPGVPGASAAIKSLSVEVSPPSRSDANRIFRPKDIFFRTMISPALAIYLSISRHCVRRKTSIACDIGNNIYGF